MERECCSVVIHVLKAGKASSWSLDRSELKWTGTSVLGRVKVEDIALVVVAESLDIKGKGKLLAVNWSRDSMCSSKQTSRTLNDECIERFGGDAIPKASLFFCTSRELRGCRIFTARHSLPASTSLPSTLQTPITADTMSGTDPKTSDAKVSKTEPLVPRRPSSS